MGIEPTWTTCKPGGLTARQAGPSDIINNTCTELDVGQERPGAEDAVRVDSTAAEVELHSKMDATTGLPLDQKHVYY